MLWSDSYVAVTPPGSHPALRCPEPRIMTGLSGRYRCPACARKIRLDGHRGGAEIGQDAGERLAAMVWAGLTFPFRRQHEGEVAEVAAMDFWLCVSCKARDGDDVEAEFVLDGASLCGTCAAPMIKILAERMGT
jgi:hypothetical protein